MADRDQQVNFAKEYQERFEKKLKESEIAILEYWKGQIDKLVLMKPDGIASLQVQIKKTSDMMFNRIKLLKRD
jgi:hypothetical protein